MVFSEYFGVTSVKIETEIKIKIIKASKTMHPFSMIFIQLKRIVVPLFSLLLSAGLISCGSGDDRSPNVSPVSNAGDNQSIDAYEDVTLTGSATDADGTIASYTWIQTSGTTASLQNENTAILTFNAPNVLSDETLVFSLTVTDNDGGTSIDTVEVLVIANIIPTVDAGESQFTDELGEVTLTGSASDSDGTVAGYSWRQTSGAEATISNSNIATLTFSAPNVSVDETLVFTLTATDDDGATGSDTVQVDVIANIAPTVNVGDETEVEEQTTVTLTGTGADVDGSVVSYTWLQTSGTPASIQNVNSAVTNVSIPDIDIAEDLEFQLTVEDNDGDTAVDTVVLRANPNFFEITLSEVRTDCGEPVAQSVEFSFYDAEGSEEIINVTHIGTEQTYYLDPTGSEDKRTLKIVKVGRDTVVVDLERSAPLYIEMDSQYIQVCDCPTYDISLINEPSAGQSTTVLSVVNSLDRRSTINGDTLVWLDVEICEGQEDAVFIFSGAIQKSSKLTIADESEIIVDGLDDLASTELNGDTPLYTGAINYSPVSLGFALSTRNDSDKLVSILAMGNGDISDGTIRYPSFTSISDYVQRVRYPVDYTNFTLSEFPSFYSDDGNLYVSREQHTIKTNKAGLAAGFDYSIFEFENLDVDISVDELTIASTGALPFDAVLFYIIGSSGTTEIWAPIENNAIDFTKIQNAISGLDGSMYIFLTDYENVETFSDAVQTFYVRRSENQTIRSRSVLLTTF